MFAQINEMFKQDHAAILRRAKQKAEQNEADIVAAQNAAAATAQTNAQNTAVEPAAKPTTEQTPKLSKLEKAMGFGELQKEINELASTKKDQLERMLKGQELLDNITKQTPLKAADASDYKSAVAANEAAAQQFNDFKDAQAMFFGCARTSPGNIELDDGFLERLRRSRIDSSYQLSNADMGKLTAINVAFESLKDEGLNKVFNNGFFSNTIYERAFSPLANGLISKDLRAFLKEFGDEGDATYNKDAVLLTLFTRRDLSEEEFKEAYLARTLEIHNERSEGAQAALGELSESEQASKDALDEQKKAEKEQAKKEKFTPIEGHSQIQRESMEQILAKLAREREKNEQNLEIVKLMDANTQRLREIMHH